MASIKGIEGLTDDYINYEIQKGAKFVVYQYCISIFVMTFKRGSDVYFVRSGESRVKKGILYTVISLLFGWWGIPWGPIYTIGSIFTNLGGGKDVTQDLLNHISSGQAEQPQ